MRRRINIVNHIIKKEELNRPLSNTHNNFTMLQIIFLFCFSFITMLFFTKSSPLYYFNDWVDSNAFFTMGKGMIHGLVPYRDLFEQKGPLLYAIHAIAYLMFPTSFTGVYIFESIAMAVNLLFFYKIARYYLSSTASMMVATLMPFFILNEKAFKFGDSAEEFTIPFVMCLLYLVFRNINSGNKLRFSRTDYFINGLLVGSIIWIKYTLIGAWIGFYVTILILTIIRLDFKQLVNAVLFTIGGIIVACAPWLLYFEINGALRDLYNVYVYFNIYMYPSQHSLLGKFIQSLINTFDAYNANFEVKIATLLGVILFMFTTILEKDILNRIMIMMIMFFSSVIIYIGGKTLGYYFLLLTPFALLGLLCLAKIISIINKNSIINSAFGKWITITFVSLASIFVTFGYNTNIKTSKVYVQSDINAIVTDSKDIRMNTYAQLEFAKIMNKEKNPTLLNFGFLDYGFYTAANIVPNARYFEKQNVNDDIYPENRDEQLRYIKEKKTDFVVFGAGVDSKLEDIQIPYLKENYRAVSSMAQLREGQSIKYWLFQKL